MSQKVTYWCDLCGAQKKAVELHNFKKHSFKGDDRLDLCGYCRDRLVQLVINNEEINSFKLRPFCPKCKGEGTFEEHESNGYDHSTRTKVKCEAHWQ